ncbi:MAG: hypothetical protein ACREX4_25455, partial [Gammaproteobacteria bacterium]
GESTYLVIDTLFIIRNDLIHYMPESLGGDNIHRLEARLRGKFLENSLMAGSGNPYFPDKALGKGCADWSVASVTRFTDTFFSQLNIVPNYLRATFD